MTTHKKYSLKRTLLENTLTPAEQMVQDLQAQFSQSMPKGARIPRYDIEIVQNHGDCLSILTMEIDEEAGDYVWVNNLYTTNNRGKPDPMCYRKGYGKIMMQALTQAADQYGVTLELIAAPPPRLKRQRPSLPDKDELARFYAQHGFVETDRNSAQVYMRRDPAVVA